jgi:hypothetical protein
MMSRNVQRAAIPKLRRIYTSFVLRERWYCTFLEDDLRTTRKMRRSNLSAGENLLLQVEFYTKAALHAMCSSNRATSPFKIQ